MGTTCWWLRAYDFMWKWAVLSFREHYSRCDLRLEENEDEDQHGRNNTGKHHPHREGLVFAQWVDEPAPHLRVRHLQTLRHRQFLCTGQRSEVNTATLRGALKVSIHCLYNCGHLPIIWKKQVKIFIMKFVNEQAF